MPMNITGNLRLRACLAIAAVVALFAGYMATAKTVTIYVDGHTIVVRTHQRTADGLLREMGLSLSPKDILLPSPDAPLVDGSTLYLRRALPLILEADGLKQPLYTHSSTLQEVLREAGISLKPADQVLINGHPMAVTASLLDASSDISQASLIPISGISQSSAGPSYAIMAVALSPIQANPWQPRDPLRITVRRAVPIHLRDDAIQGTFFTVAETLGEALRREGIKIYLGDIVAPSLNTPVTPGMQVVIRRARPVSIHVDGKTIHTRTQAQRVEQVLAEEGVILAGKDYTDPELISPIVSNMTVWVTRVREEVVIEQEAIPYNTVWQPDPQLELDERRIVQQGVDGVYKRQIRIVYENGVETKRLLEREWVDREPTTKIIAYGTKVVLHEVMTPDGPIQYWRKMRVFTTWYNASHGWFPKGSRYYGMTRTGTWATKGVVAVDPQVIRLGTRLYIPGYGFARAEDTGGLIKGMRVDLAFDEDDPYPYSLGWVTVYLLPPVPPPWDIPYILPDYPKERR